MPVIMLTGPDNEGDFIRGLEAGLGLTSSTPRLSHH
jgi:DNA-binding response OmpR family regulator